MNFDEVIAKEGWTKEWEHRGVKCLIRRVPNMLHLCGYVGLPKDHPYVKEHKDYDYVDVVVHGGVTFSEKIKEYGKDLFFYGFDCAHSGDLVPGNVKNDFDALFFDKGTLIYDKAKGYDSYHKTYKDMEYVTKETEKMADQLIELMNKYGKL